MGQAVLSPNLFYHAKNCIPAYSASLNQAYHHTHIPYDRLVAWILRILNRGILRGHEVPFIGRCGIAHVLVDASRVPNVRIGEAVALPVRRTAASSRLPRVYKIARRGR